ncbi:MAG: response regulator [Candidatus Wallbacteria bacterium]|nr:response regulator [Candidatus Wallbacteria bacterium]
MRVLVIDDEPDLGEFIARLLRRRGHSCEITTSAEAALFLVGQHEFDLIFSDLKMPGMSGIDFFESLVACRNPLAARVAFISGNAMNPPDRQKLERTGRPFLEKPFDVARFDEFLARVEASLDGRCPAGSQIPD